MDKHLIRCSIPASALANAVALESTVIAHGLPYPRNIETALRMEEIIRQEGATPVTIGVIGGEIVVGLDRDQLERLATAPGVRKVSRRDLPIAIARRQDGATTVAATAWAAARVGISVFATGGIGGVHRVASTEEGMSRNTTFSERSEFLSVDVSADLPELAQTPVLVVCAGAKAILDLSATLEWLETHGVPVVGYGVDRFPAFYNRDSGLPVDVRVDTPEEAAALYRAQRGLGLPGGMLLTVPVPPEAELPASDMQAAIAAAQLEAAARGIRGKALTPFLLALISTLTGEASLRANLALLENNARIAARVARAMG